MSSLGENDLLRWSSHRRAGHDHVWLTHPDEHLRVLEHHIADTFMSILLLEFQSGSDRPAQEKAGHSVAISPESLEESRI